jgi:hypothetical protein
MPGIKLINVKHMIEAVRQNAKEAWVWPATGIAILSTDLLKGRTQRFYGVSEVCFS